MDIANELTISFDRHLLRCGGSKFDGHFFEPRRQRLCGQPAVGETKVDPSGKRGRASFDDVEQIVREVAGGSLVGAICRATQRTNAEHVYEKCQYKYRPQEAPYLAASGSKYRVHLEVGPTVWSGSKAYRAMPVEQAEIAEISGASRQEGEIIGVGSEIFVHKNPVFAGSESKWEIANSEYLGVWLCRLTLTIFSFGLERRL